MERDIDYIIAIAECKSVSKAAELLYISQPSLSRYLSNLEEELGMALFIRTPNGTELTAAGELYISYAKEIKRLRETMQRKLNSLKRTRIEHLRIGMTLNAATMSGMQVAEEVQARFPECHVELVNILSKDIMEGLKKEDYAFAVGPKVGLFPEYVFEKIYSESLILCVPGRYDLTPYVKQTAGEGQIPFVELKKCPDMDWVFQEKSTFVRQEADRLFTEWQISVIPKMQVTSSTLALQAAENGVGACIVALGHLAHINKTGALRFYRISEQDTSHSGVIYHKNKKLSSEEKFCISCIKEKLYAMKKEVNCRLSG